MIRVTQQPLNLFVGCFLDIHRQLGIVLNKAVKKLEKTERGGLTASVGIANWARIFFIANI